MRGIGMVDGAVLQQERAHARSLSHVGGQGEDGLLRCRPRNAARRGAGQPGRCTCPEPALN